MTAEGTFPKSAGDRIYASEYNGLCPIGTVMAWLKSYTNTPALYGTWVECNGQTLSDADSVYNGQVIPDLNGTSAANHRFLRGQSTSGGKGGADTINIAHTHTIPSGSIISTCSVDDDKSTTTSSALSAVQSILPSYYEVVWIMRIK